MESYDAVIRALLARIRSLPAPRAPRPAVDPTPQSPRGLYRVEPTDWGAGRSRGEHEVGSEDASRRLMAQSTTAWLENRRAAEGSGGLRLPQVGAVPPPRGLLACNPERRSDYLRPRWAI